MKRRTQAIAAALAVGAAGCTTPTTFFGTYPEFDSFAALRVFPEGGLVAAGYANGSGGGESGAALLRLDPNGTPLWSRTYRLDGVETRASDLVIAANGDVVLAGRVLAETDDVLVVRADGDGNPIWSTSIEGVRDERATQIESTADGGFVVTNDEQVGDNVFKLDAAGQIVWRRHVDTDGYFSNAAVLSNGLIVVAGEEVVTLSSDGFELSRRPTTVSNGAAISLPRGGVVATTADVIAVAGASEDVGVVTGFDSLGSRLWEDVLDPVGASLVEVHGVDAAPNGGVAITGRDVLYLDPWHPETQAHWPAAIVTDPLGRSVARQRLALTIDVYPDTGAYVADRGEMAMAGRTADAAVILETLGLGGPQS